MESDRCLVLSRMLNAHQELARVGLDLSQWTAQLMRNCLPELGQFLTHMASTTARCELLLKVLHLSVCLSVCLSVTAVSHAKTAEPIRMLFGRQTHMDQRNHILDEICIGATWQI